MVITALRSVGNRTDMTRDLKSAECAAAGVCMDSNSQSGIVSLRLMPLPLHVMKPVITKKIKSDFSLKSLLLPPLNSTVNL